MHAAHQQGPKRNVPSLGKGSFEGKESAVEGSSVDSQCLEKDGDRMLRPVRQQVALAKIASIA